MTAAGPDPGPDVCADPGGARGEGGGVVPAAGGGMMADGAGTEVDVKLGIGIGPSVDGTACGIGPGVEPGVGAAPSSPRSGIR
jgi:hypothetical protein